MSGAGGSTPAPLEPRDAIRSEERGEDDRGELHGERPFRGCRSVEHGACHRPARATDDQSGLRENTVSIEL